MAIVHDLAEAIVGDIIPGQMPKEEKSKLEANAMIKIKETLGNTAEAQFIHELWLEYELAETPEALFCKDLDKFEMIVQAFEYEKRNHDIFIFLNRRTKKTRLLF
jgi:putative hydrolase of HD superfamily